MEQRRWLEEARPPAADEVLLASEDGRLLEGLVTNLHVVTSGSGDSDGGSGGAEHACPANASTRGGGAEVASGPPTLWTAGMGDGVVWGTVRARVLQACAALGVAVREEAPRAADRALWREAFLSNALRVVQPLRRIECGAGNTWGHPPWALELPAPVPGAVTRRIQAALAELMPATDVSAL